ncbi:alpha-hydroxy-acid oxidizing protein [Streptomyces sp. OV198]|uniref:alpha-hydroxy-acid oxidizing protein n=1 Tax=Streptomyces sp. OV198 TaxID=1882787 RepID=UPI00359C9AE8
MYAGHNPFSVVRTAVAWPPSRPGRTMKSHWPPMAGAGEARAVVPRVNRELDGQFGDYQNEIYTDGLSGVLPALPMEFQELEARARAALSPSLLSYVAGGAGDESTQRANVSAFLRWGLVPRMMAGAARRDMSVNLFGTSLPSPRGDRAVRAGRPRPACARPEPGSGHQNPPTGGPCCAGDTRAVAGRVRRARLAVPRPARHRPLPGFIRSAPDFRPG